MLTDQSYGVIPVRLADSGPQFLLVQHKAGHWGFPKGHPEGDESEVESATRELLEETGLVPARLHTDHPFDESYIFQKKRSGKSVHKHVRYFLGRIDQGELRTCPKEVADAVWSDAAATRALLSFDEGRELFDRVTAYLDVNPLQEA